MAMTARSVECLLCAGHCAEHITHVHSVAPELCLGDRYYFIPKLRIWKLSNFSKVLELAGAGIRFQPVLITTGSHYISVLCSTEL